MELLLYKLGKMNDTNNHGNDKIGIKHYIVLFLMGLRFYFGMIVLESFTIPSLLVLVFMVLEQF